MSSTETTVDGLCLDGLDPELADSATFEFKEPDDAANCLFNANPLVFDRNNVAMLS